MEWRHTDADGRLIRVHKLQDGTIVENRREKEMWICTRDLSTKLPGYGQETQVFERGTTRVSHDHEALKAHPDCFAKEGTAPANRAIRSRRSGLARLKRPGASPPSVGVRARGSGGGGSPKAPWHLSDAKSVQTKRPRAVTDDGIYDLRSVTWPVTEPEKGARQLRDRAMRAIEKARFPQHDAQPEAIRGHLAELVDTIDGQRGDFCKHLLQTGSPSYRDLFAKAVRGGLLTGEQQMRALNLSGETGGFVLPFTLDPTIIPTSGALNQLRAISRVEQTTTNKWQGVSSSGVSAAYSVEATEATDDSPTFAAPEVECHQANSWNPASFEIDQDWGGLEPQLATLVARAKDELEATKFLTGSGTNEPFGLLTGATETVSTATKATLAAPDVDAVEAALPPAFLEDANWLGNRAMFKLVRRLDAEGGAQRWAKLPGQKAEMLDLPVNYLSSMASTVATNGLPLVCGDFSYFLIVDRIRMAIKPIPDLTGPNSRPTGMMGIYAMWRNGSKVLTPKAFRVLKVS